MAKRSNYHGFDDGKNIVEAPKIYLTSEQAGRESETADDLINCFPVGNEEGTLTLQLTHGNGLPGGRVGATFAYQPSDTNKYRYLIYYDAYNQDLWLGGASDSAHWLGWKQLASVDYVKSLFSAGYKSTGRIDPGESATIALGTYPSTAHYPLAVVTTDSSGFSSSTYITNGTAYATIKNESEVRDSCSFDWAIFLL